MPQWRLRENPARLAHCPAGFVAPARTPIYAAQNSAAFRELCQIFKISKKWQELLEYSEKMLELGIKENWIYINLGIAHKKKGYPEKAEEWFKKAVEAEPRNEAYLDYLMEVCIINKNKSLAYKTTPFGV